MRKNKPFTINSIQDKNKKLIISSYKDLSKPDDSATTTGNITESQNNTILNKSKSKTDNIVSENIVSENIGISDNLDTSNIESINDDDLEFNTIVEKINSPEGYKISYFPEKDRLIMKHYVSLYDKGKNLNDLFDYDKLIKILENHLIDTNSNDLNLNDLVMFGATTNKENIKEVLKMFTKEKDKIKTLLEKFKKTNFINYNIILGNLISYGKFESYSIKIHSDRKSYIIKQGVNEVIITGMNGKKFLVQNGEYQEEKTNEELLTLLGSTQSEKLTNNKTPIDDPSFLS